MKIYLLLLLFFLIVKGKYITIPLKRISKYIGSDEEIIEKLRKNLFQGTIQMGTPSKQYTVDFDLNNEYYFLMRGQVENMTQNYTNYDEKSSTLQKGHKSAIDSSVTLSQDILYFPYISKPVSFGIKSSRAVWSYSSGTVGLMVMPFLYQAELEYNFIKTLKANDIINQYYFSFSFKSLDEATLYIGALPSEYESEKYEKFDIKKTKIPFKEENGNWGLSFSSIKYGDKIIPIPENRPKLNMYYKLGIQFFYINNQMNDTIQQEFFAEYISKNQCQIKNSAGIIYIVCDKSVDISKFKTLYLYEPVLNYTFEFNYKDLFYEHNNKYICLLAQEPNFDDYQNSVLLGEAFIRKYRTIFDQDKNEVGYMLNPKVPVKPANSNTITIVIIVIIFVVILAILFIYIFFLRGKIIRKRYGKELDDDYVYLPKQ